MNAIEVTLQVGVTRDRAILGKLWMRLRLSKFVAPEIYCDVFSDFVAPEFIAASRSFSCTRQTQRFELRLSVSAEVTLSAPIDPLRTVNLRVKIAEEKLRVECACKFAYADRIELVDTNRRVLAQCQHQMTTRPLGCVNAPLRPSCTLILRQWGRFD